MASQHEEPVGSAGVAAAAVVVAAAAAAWVDSGAASSRCGGGVEAAARGELYACAQPRAGGTREISGRYTGDIGRYACAQPRLGDSWSCEAWGGLGSSWGQGRG